jgi:hypothetical protein
VRALVLARACVCVCVNFRDGEEHAADGDDKKACRHAVMCEMCEPQACTGAATETLTALRTDRARIDPRKTRVSKPSPGADVAAASPARVQMWQEVDVHFRERQASRGEAGRASASGSWSGAHHAATAASVLVTPYIHRTRRTEHYITDGAMPCMRTRT